MRTDGRPSLYTDEELLLKLKEFQEKHPNQRIKYSELEKETGIKVHIWQYKMKNNIENINKKITGATIPERIGYTLPSVEVMVANIEKDGTMLKYYLQTLIDMVNEFYQYKEAKKTINLLKEDYENKIAELNSENKTLKEALSNQQEVLNKYILDSNSEEKREEQNIAENVFKCNTKTLDMYENMFEELMKD